AEHVVSDLWGQVREDRLTDAGRMHGRGRPDPGVHPDDMPRLDLIEIDDVTILYGGEVDSVSVGCAEAVQVRARNSAYVVFLQRRLRERTDRGPQSVAAVRTPAYEPLSLQ